MTNLYKIKARARALASERGDGVRELVDDVFQAADDEVSNNAFNFDADDEANDTIAIVDDWAWMSPGKWHQTASYGEETTIAAQDAVKQALRAFGE